MPLAPVTLCAQTVMQGTQQVQAQARVILVLLGGTLMELVYVTVAMPVNTLQKGLLAAWIVPRVPTPTQVQHHAQIV